MLLHQLLDAGGIDTFVLIFLFKQQQKFFNAVIYFPFLFFIWKAAAEVQRFKIEGAVSLKFDIGLGHGIDDDREHIYEHAVAEEIRQ